MKLWLFFEVFWVGSIVIVMLVLLRSIGGTRVLVVAVVFCRFVSMNSRVCGWSVLFSCWVT